MGQRFAAPENQTAGVAVKKYLMVGYRALFAALCWAAASFAQTDWTLYQTINSGLPDNNVQALAPDGQGGIWVGTEVGLAHWDGSSWSTWLAGSSGLPDNAVRALAVEPESGALWVGTFLGGLARLESGTWQVWNSGNSPMPDNYVRSLKVEGPGKVWIGTTAGLLLYDQGDWTLWDIFNSSLPGNNIPSVDLDPDGTPWVGTINNGLGRYDGKGWENWTIANSALIDNTILDMARDSSGNRWLATPAGGLVLMSPSAEFLTFNIGNSGIPDNEVARVAVDARQHIWLGMRSAGLAQYDGSVWTRSFSGNSNLPDDRIQALLLEPEGGIWLGMAEGGLAYRAASDTVSGLGAAVLPRAVLRPFPNPARAGTAVQTGYEPAAARPGYWVLFDANGLEVLREPARPGQGLNLPDALSPGAYLLHFLPLSGALAAPLPARLLVLP